MWESILCPREEPSVLRGEYLLLLEETALRWNRFHPRGRKQHSEQWKQHSRFRKLHSPLWKKNSCLWNLHSRGVDFPRLGGNFLSPLWSLHSDFWKLHSSGGDEHGTKVGGATISN